MRNTILTLMFLLALAAGPAAARDPGCTYFGHNICLRLPPLSEVHYRFGSDFFVHGVTTPDGEQFGIFEGDFPNYDEEKCTLSKSNDFGKLVEWCSYTDEKQSNFVFRIYESALAQVQPTMIHAWFTDSGDHNKSLQILKKYMIIEQLRRANNASRRVEGISHAEDEL